MSAVLQFQYKLNTLECYKCQIVFAVPETFERERRRDHKSFFCPAGHPQYFFGKSDLELLEEQVAEKERALVWERNRAAKNHERAEATQRQLTATRGVVTRTKNRIAKGKCPKCSKQFSDLAHHMAETHPDYAVDTGK